MEDIKLESGLTLKEPECMIMKYVAEMYVQWDEPPAGVTRVKQDSSLAILDILFSLLLNSRIRSEGVWNLWQARESINEALAVIPPSLELTASESEVPWDALETLLRRSIVPWVRIATATKILHRKRPKLIPVLDSVLQGYYWERCRTALRGLEEWERGVAMMRKFRDDLMHCKPTIDYLCNRLEQDRKLLTPVRVLEALIWMATEPNGYYRKKRSEEHMASIDSS